jgi:hypothetical protein
MQERVADSTRAVHRSRQIVAAGLEIAGEEVGITDGSQ